MDRQTSLGMASTAQLCRAFHPPRQVLHAAAKPRVIPLPRSQRPGPWANAETLQAAIQCLVKENPAWGVRKVWAVLRMDGLLVSRRRVHALRKALGLLLPPSREGRQPAPRGHVAVPESNRRPHHRLDPRDGLVAVLPVVDCGDRYCFDARVSVSQESRPVLAPVRHALEPQFATPAGVPADLELHPDHGLQYTGGGCRDFWRTGTSTTPSPRSAAPLATPSPSA